MSPERGPLGTVLVIVPTYNESMNVTPIVQRIRAANPDAHVLVADDGSPDGTGEIADGLAAQDDHVHVLHRSGKEGLAAAYVAGFRWGIEHAYGVLVEHDADGSHQPEQLPRLLKALENADMVKGSRYVKGGTVVNWPKSRELLSRAGNIWSQLVLGVGIKDLTGGYNAHRTSMMRVIIDDIESAGYAFQVNLAWQALQHGFTVVEVPIEFIEREQGASKMSRSIVLEALALTTKWGLEHRKEQLKKVLGMASKTANQAGKQALETGGKLAGEAQKAAKQAGEYVQEHGPEIVEKAQKAAKQAGDYVQEHGPEIVEKVQKAAKQAGDYVQEQAPKVKAEASKLADKAKDKLAGK